jgi:hypothetical protein
MLIWIRHYSNVYSDKRNEELKQFLIDHTSFVGAAHNYNLLGKALMSQRQLHRKQFDIGTTIKQ